MCKQAIVATFAIRIYFKNFYKNFRPKLYNETKKKGWGSGKAIAQQA